MIKSAALALVMLVTPAWADELIVEPAAQPDKLVVKIGDRRLYGTVQESKGSLPDTVEQWWFTEPVTVIRTEQCFGASIN